MGSPLNHEDDQQLIGRIRAGECRAFESLMSRWETNVLNIAYRITGDHDTALDIRQKTFLRVHSALSNFDSRSKFSTWIYRIVVNICRDEIRSKKHQLRVVSSYKQQVKDDFRYTNENEEKIEIISAIIEVMMTLPVSLREAVILRHYHGLSFAQMSEILEVPTTTLTYRTLQGLKQLRKRLKIDC